jgi:hypothetical protein
VGSFAFVDAFAFGDSLRVCVLLTLTADGVSELLRDPLVGALLTRDGAAEVRETELTRGGAGVSLGASRRAALEAIALDRCESGGFGGG